MKISRNKVSEKGTGGVSKTDEFLEKFQTANLTPKVP